MTDSLATQASTEQKDSISPAEIAAELHAFLDVYNRTHMIDQDIFQNLVTFLNGIAFKDTGSYMVISTGSKNGTKIGKSTTEKLAFYGSVPIIQQATITAPTGGSTVDTQSRTAINAIITALANLGLIA